MKTKLTLAAIALICTVSLPALADGPMPHKKAGHHHQMKHHHPMMMKHDMMKNGGPFDMMDTNHNGFISKAEADACFKKMDTNHDGKISKQEWMACMKKCHEAMLDKHHMASDNADYMSLNQ